MTDATYKLKNLTGRKLQVFLAAADCIIPPDPGSPGGGTMETAAVVDWALNRLDPEMRALFLKFMVALDFIGVFFGGRTFKNNSMAARERQLRWTESCPLRPFRMGFFGLKSYVCMGYYTREATWPEFGYGGPHVPERAYPDTVIRGLEQGALEVAE
ncbi:MAG: hypothetical protein GC168_12435 [Candidatus Hydrogenedens sp.]|nr:hypothetical protein [Candidatus Hydrogenedens sp.]